MGFKRLDSFTGVQIDFRLLYYNEYNLFNNRVAPNNTRDTYACENMNVFIYNNTRK